MSLYRYLSSKKPLPIVERSYISKNNGEVGIIDTSNFTLDDYSIDAQFEVLLCRTIPPIPAGNQIQKPYVYKVRGVNKHLNQLVEYIKKNVKEEERVELWSIWHSDKVPLRNMRRLDPREITEEDLLFLHDNENSCIKFFPKSK